MFQVLKRSLSKHIGRICDDQKDWVFLRSRVRKGQLCHPYFCSLFSSHAIKTWSSEQSYDLFDILVLGMYFLG